jgi:glyoxalase family protein
MKILGLHHITLVSSNAQRTVDFYVKVLGQRLVKQTVNFDDPSAYHLYFGDTTGRPGTAITFFEWPHAGRGRHGIGGTHHFAMRVADETGLLKWKRRLTDLGVTVRGPYNRYYFKSIYFRDPDGVNLEIATDGPGWTLDEAPDALGTTRQMPPETMRKGSDDYETLAQQTWPEPVPLITPDMALMNGMHHITAISSSLERTHEFFAGVLGMRRVKMTANFDDETSAHWYWGVDDGMPGTLVTYFERRPGDTQRAAIGAGMTHHFALAVADEAEQVEWRRRLQEAGYRVSPIMDRDYFRSIYTSDPDGHIVELATVAPGFVTDETAEELGQRLQLPSWLRPHREQIERGLKPLVVPDWRAS